MKMNLSKQCMVLWNMSLEGRNAQIQVLTPLSAANWTWAGWSVSLNFTLVISFFFFFTLVISKADMIMPFAQMFIVRIRGQSKCFAQSWYWKMLRVQVIDAPGALWPEIPIIRLRLGPWLWQCLGRGPSTRHRLLALSVFVQMLGPCACECTTEWWFSWFKSQVWTQRRKMSGDSTCPVS